MLYLYSTVRTLYVQKKIIFGNLVLILCETHQQVIKADADGWHFHLSEYTRDWVPNYTKNVGFFSEKFFCG
jgi:hypothetical protein